MQAAGYGIDNLPFYDVRLLIGEAAACLAWAACLLVWSSRPLRNFSKKNLLVIWAALFAIVLSAYGGSKLVLANFHKDVYFLLTSITATLLSALILVLLKNKHSTPKGEPAARY
jgi:hypothetical protein